MERSTAKANWLSACRQHTRLSPLTRLQLKGVEKDLEDQGSEHGRTSSEHEVADGAGVVVASFTEVAISPAVNDDDELEEKSGKGDKLKKNRTHAQQASATHHESVGHGIDNNRPGEDTMLQVMRRSQHDRRLGGFQTETEGGRRRRQHVHPQDTERRQWEDGVLGVVDKGETEDEEQDFGDVGGEQVEDESLDVDEDPSSFLDSGTDRVEVTVKGKEGQE